MIKEEEGRRTRKEAGVEKRGKDGLVNECVRCTLFPSPMSEPRLGYFRDISFERERGEKERGDTERMRVVRETMRASVRACARMLSRRECHRSISRGGWNFWPSRGVSRREKEREEVSRVWGEKGEERDDATMDGWMDER